MGSQYAYGEQNNAHMPYYAAPRGFNTVAEHIKAGQAVEHIPHRLFVGGFGAQITEAHLREHFERFFTIRDVKVIRSGEGISKGYGFVTFDTEEEAKAVQAMSQEKLKLNGKTLNLGPALRKMVHPPRYNSEYAMMMSNNSQYALQSPTMQYSYAYPSPPQNGTPYMMGYAPQGMIPVAQSPPDESSPQSLDSTGGCGEEQQMLQLQPAPAGGGGGYGPMQLSPQSTVYAPSYYVPPPTPMTPTFRGMPCAPLYYPPHTPQMTVDGATLFPQMVGSPMMFHHHHHPQQYFPPTPSMDASSYYMQQQHQSPTVAAPSPAAADLHQHNHYPPLVVGDQQAEEGEEGGAGGGEEKGHDVQLTEDGVKQPETSIGDIRASYATIAAKIKSEAAAATLTTAAKEVDQMAAVMGSMKMNGGGDYAATTKHGAAAHRV